MFGSASAPPSGLRSSGTEHPQHQRPRGWARTNHRSGPNQVAKVTRSVKHLVDLGRWVAQAGSSGARFARSGTFFNEELLFSLPETA